MSVSTSCNHLNLDLPNPCLSSGLVFSIIFHSDDVFQPFQSFNFDISHNIWWLICILYCEGINYEHDEFLMEISERSPTRNWAEWARTSP
jgi:hypothetical protein